MEDRLRQIVQEEIRAIFEAFEFDNNKTYTVPDNVARIAKKALDEVEQNNLTLSNTKRGSGVQKAKQLSNKETQSHEQMKSLKSFFETNEDEYRQAKIKGLTIKNSGVIQSFELHGGIAAREWVNHKIKITKQSNLNTKKNLRSVGSDGVNKGMGIFSGKNIISTTNHRIHR